MMQLRKIADNKELMEGIRGDPDIYVSSDKDFRSASKEKYMEINNLCTWDRYRIAQTR